VVTCLANRQSYQQERGEMTENSHVMLRGILNHCS
jgi:hypothetical protein